LTRKNNEGGTWRAKKNWTGGDNIINESVTREGEKCFVPRLMIEIEQNWALTSTKCEENWTGGHNEREIKTAPRSGNEKKN
jgi:hypothetical protein